MVMPDISFRSILEAGEPIGGELIGCRATPQHSDVHIPCPTGMKIRFAELGEPTFGFGECFLAVVSLAKLCEGATRIPLNVLNFGRLFFRSLLEHLLTLVIGNLSARTKCRCSK